MNDMCTPNTIYKSGKLASLNDYFKDLNSRSSYTYRYRIETINSEIENFLTEYNEEAKKTHTVVESKLNNPDPKSIAYLFELIGSMDFEFDKQFILNRLNKAVPRITPSHKTILAESILKEMTELKNNGKSDGAIKNTYTKIIYWLSSKYESVSMLLGKSIPKFLIRYYPSQAELSLFNIFANSGCDLLFLLENGDANYIAIDKTSSKSTLYQNNGKPIPANYIIKTRSTVNNTASESNIQKKSSTPSIPTISSKYIICTNAWMINGNINEIKESLSLRGQEDKMIYNAFIQYNGVWQKSTYVNDLYQVYTDIKNANRQICIIENSISNPTVEESKIFTTPMVDTETQLINDLASQIRYDFNYDLRTMMINAFKEIMIAECKVETISIGKLSNKAKIILCWLKRYESQILRNWKKGQIGCFIYLGGCTNKNEVLFLQLLSKLPVDVIILNPNIKNTINPTDNMFLIKNYEDSMTLDKYPTDMSQFRVGTVAYHAERELDTLMYQDSGIYRNRQFSKANALTLSTMYEEIGILWNQEPKFRPGFSTTDTEVNIPVIFAKVSGIKDGNEKEYWNTIQNMVTDNTIIATSSHYINIDDESKQIARLFHSNNGVFRDKIREHRTFKYNYLRDEVIDYMFDKLDLLIKNKFIKGTGENGVEYDIIATILNLPKEVIRIIQSFDFTKANPKLLYILTNEDIISLEDTILANYLNLIGFDVVFFVPTGYQSIEKYLNISIEEHQIGQYKYDLKIPSKILNSSTNSTSQPKVKQSFIKRLFN